MADAEEGKAQQRRHRLDRATPGRGSRRGASRLAAGGAGGVLRRCRPVCPPFPRVPFQLARRRGARMERPAAGCCEFAFTDPTVPRKSV
jgi:hypothetical protein